MVPHVLGQMDLTLTRSSDCAGMNKGAVNLPDDALVFIGWSLSTPQRARVVDWHLLPVEPG